VKVKTAKIPNPVATGTEDSIQYEVKDVSIESVDAQAQVPQLDPQHF